MFVFDASTLILIAKTEILDSFLRDVGLHVAIPPEVEKECCSVKKSLDALMIKKALDESRIRVTAVKDRKLVTKVQGDFDSSSAFLIMSASSDFLTLQHSFSTSGGM